MLRGSATGRHLTLIYVGCTVLQTLFAVIYEFTVVLPAMDAFYQMLPIGRRPSLSGGRRFLSPPLSVL